MILIRFAAAQYGFHIVIPVRTTSEFEIKLNVMLLCNYDVCKNVILHCTAHKYDIIF